MSHKQDFWEAHIEAWQASGQSQSRYCRERELAVGSFGYWRRKLDDAANPGVTGMIPIVSSATRGPLQIEIALSNGVTLRVPLSAERKRPVSSPFAPARKMLRCAFLSARHAHEPQTGFLGSPRRGVAG